jgi:hypothetical protein
VITDAAPTGTTSRREFDASDALTAFAPPPPAGALPAATLALCAAVEGGDSKDVRRACAGVLSPLADFFGVAAPPVRVLGVRPHRVNEGVTTYQLYGDYSPDTQRVRVWLRTAVRGKVSSPRSFLSTLVHEFCHHLDGVTAWVDFSRASDERLVPPIEACAGSARGRAAGVSVDAGVDQRFRDRTGRSGRSTTLAAPIVSARLEVRPDHQEQRHPRQREQERDRRHLVLPRWTEERVERRLAGDRALLHAPRGVEVRCHDPLRWDAPLASFSRDHRKTLSVDGVVGFVAGLCIGQMWLGQPDTKIAPRRDTGIELRGPAVAQLEDGFSSLWGDPPSAPQDDPPAAGVRCGGSTPVCLAGACRASSACTSPNNNCSNACVNRRTSPFHCGDCGERCDQDEVCVAGNCRNYDALAGCTACPCACPGGDTCCASPDRLAGVCIEGSTCP